MTQTQFQNIILKSISNLDIKYIDKLNNGLDIYSQNSYLSVKNTLKQLFDKLSAKQILKLKIYCHFDDDTFSCLTTDMLFIIRYSIKKESDGSFAIEESLNDIPF